MSGMGSLGFPIDALLRERDRLVARLLVVRVEALERDVRGGRLRVDRSVRELLDLGDRLLLAVLLLEEV